MDHEYANGPHLPDPLAPMRGLVAAVLIQLAVTAFAVASFCL